MALFDSLSSGAANATNDRRSCRGAVGIAGTIRAVGGSKIRITVVDISATGFRMECSSYTLIDQFIFLTMPGFESLQATIIWQTEWMCGCQFTHPLHPAVYDHIVRTHPALDTR